MIRCINTFSGMTAKSYHEDEIIKTLLIFFDVTCIWVSGLSMILCLRSLKRAFRYSKDPSNTDVDVGHSFSVWIMIVLFPSHSRLLEKTDDFLKLYKGQPLTSSERWEFVNFWYLTIILNDILAIIGSFSKIMMETKGRAVVVSMPHLI